METVLAVAMMLLMGVGAWAIVRGLLRLVRRSLRPRPAEPVPGRYVPGTAAAEPAARREAREPGSDDDGDPYLRRGLL